MKKILSIVLTLAIVLGTVGVPVFAEEVEVTETTEVAETVTDGITTEAALKAAIEAGGDVSLEGNILVNTMMEVPANVTVTLDLNGYEITSGYQTDNAEKHIYPFDIYGNLTIKDTAENGSITGRGIYVQDGSKLTVESGAVYGIDANGGSALYQYGGDIVINGGRVEQKAEGTYNFAIYAGGGTVTVNGGWVGGNHGAISTSGAVVTLNEGEFVCTGTEGMTDNVLYSSGNGSIIINGGTFVADSDGPAGGCCIYDANGKVTVNDGDFSNSSGGDVWGATGTTINGGTFENLIETSHVTVGATITNAGVTYTMTESGLEEGSGNVAQVGDTYYTSVLEALEAAIAAGASEVKLLADSREVMTKDFDIKISADLTITADKPVKAEFYNDDTKYDFAIGSTNNNKLTIAENVHIDLVDRVIWIGYWGNNVDVQVDGYLGAYQIWHGADTTVSATGMLDSHSEALVMRRDATLTVNGGNVNANYLQIYSGHINATDADIDAGLVWIYNNHEYGGEGTVSMTLNNTNFASNGVIKAYAGEGKTVEISLTNGSTLNAKGEVTTDTATVIVADETSTFTSKNETALIAQIGDTKYASFDAAFAAAQSGDTVEIIADEITVGDITIPDGVTLKMDGGKFTANSVTLGDDALFNVYGESTLNIDAVSGGTVDFWNGAVICDSDINGNVYILGVVTFRGDNTFAMLYDYGAAYSDPGADWTVEPGASVTLTNTGRHGLGYGDKITIKGELTNALTARETGLTTEDASFFTHGISMMDSWDEDNYLTVEDAYVIIGSNNSFGTKGDYGLKGKFYVNFENSVLDSSRVTIVEGGGTADFTFNKSDVKVGVWSNLSESSSATFTDSKMLATGSGNDYPNKNVGQLTLVNSDITFETGAFTNTGNITLDMNSSITAPELAGDGTITVDAESFNPDGEPVVLINTTTNSFTGEIKVINNPYADVKVGEDGTISVVKNENPVIAKIGETGYATLAEAVAAVKDGETINILSGTISEGTIKLPATLENVTIKSEEGAVLKDMTISAADGNSLDYDGIIFDGITFDNSRILITGWRSDDVDIKNLTITNCIFKNLYDETNSAPVHINMDETEAIENFTFTNNVIDGATGGQKSGIYMAATGNVTVTGNTFNNIVFRPALIQLADCDGTVDNVVVSDNVISNTTRLQIYGSEEGADEGPWTPSGTDTLKIAINKNIFKNISGYYICTWGINGEADIAENYYDTTDLGGKIYWNNEKPTDEAGLAELGIYPIYTELNEDGTINLESEYTYVPEPTGDASIAYIKNDRIYGEATGNASKSWVMKVLDANGNVMGTTSLNNIDGIIDGDVTVTWNLLIDAESNDDKYWTMEWTTAPTADNIPASVELWIDGVPVDTGVVKLNRPDDSYPVIAAVTDDNGVVESFVCANGYTNNMKDVAASLAAAITEDANVVLLRDVKLESTIKVSGKSFNLNGNGHTISGNGGLWLLSGSYDIKNVTFDNITNSDDYGVLEFTYAEANVTDCTFSNNNVKSCIAVDTNAAGDGNSEVTIDGCTFTGNTCSTSVINSAEGSTTVKNSAITGNTASIAVIYNSADCNVTGNVFSDNTLIGENANKAVILSGPWVEGNYNVSITENAFLDADYVSAYIENWAEEYNAVSTNVLNSNYWLDGDAPVAGKDYVFENDVTATLDNYYTKYNEDGTLGDLISLSSPVAQIGDVKYIDLQEALNAAAAMSGDVTVEILDDIDLTNVDWTPVLVSGPDYPMVTVNGNNKTITGLNDMLFSGTWAGDSGLVINDLTIKDSDIVNDENDTQGTVGVGAFIGYPQASAVITLNNCHLVDSTVSGGHWTGGLIGIAGGYAGNDGPVFMNLTIKDCSVTGSTITGKGSVGAIIGHASCNTWTDVVIEDTAITGNTITSTGSSTNKAGIVMGTIGAAGTETTVNGTTLTGGVNVAVTESNNTATSNGTTITTVYGRQGTETGVLAITGGTYENYPIEEGVSYAAPAEGYEIVENEDGTYGIEEVATTISGTLSTCYANEYVEGESRITGELNVNATESVVVKLYSDETLLATTTLLKEEYFVYDGLTLKICIADDSSSWKTVWEDGMPRADYQPNKAVLYVDGQEMNTADVNMWNNDFYEGYEGQSWVWAELTGVNPAPVAAVAKIGDVEYSTLQSAIDAAAIGDTITVIADVADEAVNVDKALTITADAENKPVLSNVSISATGENVTSLTVSNLSFVGNSWINSGTADALTVSSVDANVTPVNTDYTNSRSAFISLGRSEQKELDLTVENCNIVTSGDRTNPILGWAAIKTATITGNTFGSEDAYQTNSDSVKFMSIAEGAVFNITGNTVYSNYNGFVFGQNTTRDNAYTVNVDANHFYGSADHVWIEVSGADTTHATIKATSNNTVNGEAFTVNDIKASSSINVWTSYAGVDVVTDESGKIISGSFLNEVAEDLIAEGCTSVEQKDGSFLVGMLPDAEVANLGRITVTSDEGDYQFGSSYYVYDLIGGGGLSSDTEPFDMSIAMQFVAKDSEEEAAANAFGQYTTDFFITITGLENGSFAGDGCYLAGYYPSFGAWVKIPLDGFTIEDGKIYPVITSAGFDFSYVDICSSVQDFICGIYLTDEVIAANPNINVNLTLGLSEDMDSARSAKFVEVDEYDYVAADFKKAVSVTGLNVRLQDLIKIGFYFKPADGIEAEEVGGLLWTAEDYIADESHTVESKKAKNYTNLTPDASGTYIVETDGVFAHYLDQIYYFVPYIKTADGEYKYGDADMYSVLDYAESAMQLDPTTYGEAQKLVINLLNYGTYAREYFGYTENIAAPTAPFNSILTDEQKELGWTEALNKAYGDAVETKGTFAPELYAHNANIQSAISFSTFYKDTDIDGAYYWTSADSVGDMTQANAAVTSINASVYTQAVINSIYSFNIYDEYYVCAYDSEQGIDRNAYAVSVAAYLTDVIEYYGEKTDAESLALVNLCKSMQVYGNNADSYFAQ